MATDTSPTSNKNSPSSMNRDSLSQEDQEVFIKILEDPSTLQQFSDACKHIGQTAVAVDEDFRAVKNGFAAFIEQYGNDFPDVAQVYVPRWEGFMARWNGETGLLWSSRKLAADTAATLSEFEVNLIIVQGIDDLAGLTDAQAILNVFISNHPIEVSTNVADGFKNLRSDIENFSKDFKNYMTDQQQILSEGADNYEVVIAECEEQIAQLDKKIVAAAIDLGAAAPFSFIARIILGAILDQDIKQRNHVQAELYTAIAGLGTVIADQVALAAMQAEFEKLKPGIKEICHNLGIFATIWAYTTEQSTEINNLLDAGLATTYNLVFKTLIRLLKAQVPPLQEGLRQYAIQITPP